MCDLAEAVARITRWRGFDKPAHGIWAVEHSESGRLLSTLFLKDIPASQAVCARIGVERVEQTESGSRSGPADCRDREGVAVR